MKKITAEIFKEYDIRGLYLSQIDEGVAYRLGRAFILATGAKKIIVGADRRVNSAKILKAFTKGAGREGGQIANLGICSTPELFFALGKKGFAGGVMATASHNPAGYVGFKLAGHDGVAIGLKTGLRKIQKISLRLGEEGDWRKMPRIKNLNIQPQYLKTVLSLVNKNKLKKLKLVLDASGGSGDKLANYVFSRLPLKVTKINFSSPSQKAPHSLNPLLSGSQKATAAAVRKIGADLGVVWDGDGDRCIFLDERGKFVYPYHINCLLAKIVLKKKKARLRRQGIGIAVDARLPVGIGEVIKANGGQEIVSRSGTANIIKIMKAKKLLFGCENSGHYFFNFSFFPINPLPFKRGSVIRRAGASPDSLSGRESLNATQGAFNAAQDRRGRGNFVFGEAIAPTLLILEYLADHQLKLSQAIAEFGRLYPISGEINLAVKDFAMIKNKLKQIYRGKKFVEIDGLSVFGRDWFFNLRPSHTEPLARLNIEARSGAVLKKIKKEILELVGD